MAHSIPSLMVLGPGWHDVFRCDRCTLVLGPGCQLVFTSPVVLGQRWQTLFYPLWSQDWYVTMILTHERCILVLGPRCTLLFSCTVVLGQRWQTQIYPLWSQDWDDTMILTHKRCTLVLGPRCQICNFFPCGPRTEMPNLISSTLVLGPVWTLCTTWSQDWDGIFVLCHSGPKDQNGHFVRCGPRTGVAFFCCHCGPGSTTVVLAMIHRPRTTMSRNHSGPRTRRSGPDGLVL